MEKTSERKHILSLIVALSFCLTASLLSTEVTTTREIKLPMLLNGQSVGSVTLPAGSTVETDGKIAPDGTVLITRGEMSSRVEAAAINPPTAKTSEQKTKGEVITEEKIKAIEALAERGDASAQNKMGMIYKHGWGVQQDDKKAIAWFQRSAYLSNPDGERNLASMLKRDPKNIEKANKLLAQAALSGDKLAEKILKASLPSTAAPSPTKQVTNQKPHDPNQALSEPQGIDITPSKPTPPTDNSPKAWALVDQKTGKAIGLKEKTEAEKKADTLNDALGLPLFSPTPLLEESPESVAARLNLPKEVETPSFCSFSQSYKQSQIVQPGVHYQSVAEKAPWTGPTLGDCMVSSITLEARDGKTINLSLAMDVTPNEGGQNFEAVQAVLTKLFGPSQQAIYGPGNTAEHGERWTNNNLTFFLVGENANYTALRLIPSERFNDPKWNAKKFSETKKELPSRVIKETKGDIHLNYPKGIVPEDGDRFLGILNLTRYYGLSAPVEQLKQSSPTDTLHGARVIIENAIDDAGGHSSQINLGMKEIKTSIQAGRPILLEGVAFSQELSKRIGKRRKIREEIKDPEEWKKLLASDRYNLSQIGERSNSWSPYLPILILGYNEKTGEVALADFSTDPSSLDWVTIEEIEHSYKGIGKTIE